MLKLKKFVLPLFLAASMLISIPVYAVSSSYVGIYDYIGSVSQLKTSFIELKSSDTACFYNGINSNEIGYFRGTTDTMYLNLPTHSAKAHFSAYTQLTGFGYTYKVYTTADEYIESYFSATANWTGILIDYYQIDENGYGYRYYK